MEAQRDHGLLGEPDHSDLIPGDSQRAPPFGRIEPPEYLSIALQLQSTPEDGILARLTCVAVDRLVLSGPVDLDGEMNRIRCSPNELDGELGAKSISHLGRERPSQDRKRILLANGAGGVCRPHVVGMSGNAAFVEHEEKVRPFLLDGEPDFCTQFGNRRFGHPPVTELEKADAPDPKGFSRRTELSLSDDV